MNSRWGAISSLVSVCVLFGGFNHVLASPLTSNLSLAGTATATGADFGSSVQDGIDGNRDGNFGNGSVFYGNANPPTPLFYEVDLGSSNYIDRVQILRRTDADQAIFGNMRLTIFQDDGAGGHGPIAFTKDYLPSAFTIGSWGTTDPGASAPGGAFGRHVRLERIDNQYWLTFAEFEVIGRATPLTFTEANNLTAAKPVTTSSAPGFGALITSGNDGNINADFNHPDRSVYHSNNFGAGEYWQVDLGVEKPLDFLELYSRSDGGTTSQFKVSVLNSALAEVGSVIVDNSAPNAVVPDYDHLINVSGMTGRYIRVATTRDEYLAFTELRAFAAVPEPSTLVLGCLALFGYGWRYKRRS